MAWARAAVALLAVVAVALVVVSGGSDADPRTPAALPGLPPPFLGTAVAGSGELTAAVDAYGDVVDLRPSPAGPALIENPAARQAAGTVPANTGIVPRVSFDGGPAMALWQADSIEQHYLPATNVMRTAARFGRASVVVTVAAWEEELAMKVAATSAVAVPSVGIDVNHDLRCAHESQRGQLDLLCRVGRAVPSDSGGAVGDVGEVVRTATASDRRWIAKARPLSARAPGWARAMYARSLLTLRALTDSRSGAVAAGARDGWAYAWPRDAATAALALEAAGYRREAQEVARFLSNLDLGAAARFTGSGEPVPGRSEQGDANGWVQLAAVATGSYESGIASPPAEDWRSRADYQEGGGGEYLGNAIVGGANLRPFEANGGLVRRARDPGSGLDSAAAWAVRPFPRPDSYAQVRRTLLRLLAAGTSFGITPGEGWSGGSDPWTAPTAWSAWSLAALAEAEAAHAPNRARADRAAALRLLGDMRRAATPAGSLPERVDAVTGVPRSTTPLAWSHAFAILALRQLWPDLM
ncbi:MAG TPA: glycoside hydrolase family 15 protein [Solirubrobacterales bacterium]|nr:glycoside hydrolase family 15 protein [Solirubrobacterales bacterium]